MNSYLMDLKIQNVQDELRQLEVDAKAMVEARQEECKHVHVLEAHKSTSCNYRRFRVCKRCGLWDSYGSSIWYILGKNNTVERVKDYDSLIGLRNALCYS